MTNYISTDPLNNLTNTFQRPIFINAERAPTTADIYPPGSKWQYNTQYSDYGGSIYETSGGGAWFLSDTNNVARLTGNTGSATPDSNQNINIIGTTGQISVTGSGSTLTLALTGGGTAIDTIQVDSGGPVTPNSSGVVSLVGSSNISVVASAAPTNQASIGIVGQIPVANGGTAASSFSNVNSVVLSGSTGTSALTTSTSGASGTVLTSAGPGVVPTWSNPALVLIQEQGASNSSSIQFTNLGNTSYRSFLLVINTVIPATDGAILNMFFSNDNGNTYGTSYSSGINYNSYNSATITNANSSSAILLSQASTNANQGMDGSFYLFSMNQARFPSVSGTIIWEFQTTETETFGNVFASGGATGINAIKLQFSSGNITSGRFALYGLSGIGTV